MPTMALYTLAIPGDATTRTEGRVRRNLSSQGVLQGDLGAVESISLKPGQQLLRGQFRAKYAQLMATEVEELFDAAGIEIVPFFGTEEKTPVDGYYTLENVDTRPEDPREAAIQTFDGVLTKVGTRHSHWRAVRTTVSDYATSETGTIVSTDTHVGSATVASSDGNENPYENPYGSGETVHLGLPSTASKVRWVDEVSGELTSASADLTRTGEFLDVDLYDVDAPSFSDPTLLYELSYGDEGKADVKLWDDHDRAKADGDVANTWQRVFRTGHDYTGNAVLENGVLRLVFDEDAQTLDAYRWDDATSSYSQVTLGSSDWVLFDLDIARIGAERVTAQVTFVNTSSGSLYYLSLDLKRGYRDAVWTVPDNEDSKAFPSGLETKLEPIASGIASNPAAQETVIPRSEVRR